MSSLHLSASTSINSLRALAGESEFPVSVPPTATAVTPSPLQVSTAQLSRQARMLSPFALPAVQVRGQLRPPSLAVSPGGDRGGAALRSASPDAVGMVGSELARQLVLPEPKPMESIFVPGSVPGTPKSANAYATYMANYRHRLTVLIENERLQSAHLVRGGLAGGAVMGAHIGKYRTAAVRLGSELFARSNHWQSGAFGKIQSLLGNRGLLALKILRSTPSSKRQATKATSKEIAQRETAFLKKYVSPQVELYFDSQTQKHGIVMEMLAGSMADLRDNEFFTDIVEERTFCMLKQVLEQLCDMHADGVSHLDIKPGNIMVFGDGRIRACDMGLARFADESMELGTMAYLAPETLHSLDAKKNGSSRDLWALGLSALEGFMPLEATPFNPRVGFGIYGVLRNFIDWHESMRTEGVFDMIKLLSDLSNDRFTRMFQTLYAKSPRVCLLLAHHFLVPEDMRVSAKDGLRLCKEAFPDGDQAEMNWSARVQNWAEHQDFRRVHEAALRLRLQDEADAGA